MKLEDEKIVPSSSAGEVDLSELRREMDREARSPSSFNKSMDFARHTKKSVRTPPSRDCSTDSVDLLGSSFASASMMGESFLGDSFAEASFAYSHDDCHDEAHPRTSQMKRPDLETVVDLESDEDGHNSSKDLSTDAEGEKTE